MSKKKNTLRDLDDFLKQQAANLVAPERLSDKLDVAQPAKSKPVATKDDQEIEIVEQVKTLVQKNGHSSLCDIIIQSLDTEKESSPEEMMLINTALYLKSGDSWKSEIKEYWKRRKS